nr:PDDEXK nuclease domain-containing protein [uncultured Brevundimonas sp.]
MELADRSATDRRSRLICGLQAPLTCFVVIELKIEDFKPEFAGKMNFYLSAVDDQLRHPD